MKLTNLIKTAIDADKLETMEVIETLVDKIDELDKEASKKLYKCFYEKAYGPTISKELADEIVKSFAVTDKSERENGLKWNYDQTTSVGSQIGVDWSKVFKVPYYVVMNMVYSDDYETAKEFELENDPTYFAHRAKSWLCDADIPNGNKKLFDYIFSVVM